VYALVFSVSNTKYHILCSLGETHLRYTNHTFMEVKFSLDLLYLGHGGGVGWLGGGGLKRCTCGDKNIKRQQQKQQPQQPQQPQLQIFVFHVCQPLYLCSFAI
jgi:hypothetical protein